MNRILQVDFFRGFFLIIIATNHFLSKDNIIHYFTYEFIGWVTAAEGFVFLSGLTAGIVYSRKLVEKGEGFISLAARKRAWTIYKYHLILFLLVTIILFSNWAMKEYWFYETQEFKLLFLKPVFSLLLGSVLLYQPIYLDILPMYALYMLLLPLVLKYFQKGNQILIMAGSFFIYLIGTFDLFSINLIHDQLPVEVNSGFFNLLSWQFLFVAGLYLGFLTYQGQISRLLQNKSLVWGALISCALLFLFKQVHYRISNLPLDLNYWVSKENLGPLRLFNFFSFLVVMSYLAARYKQWFSFNPICYLGKYSLEVFSIHIILLILLAPLKEFSNNFHAVRLTNSLYFYPWATIILLFLLLPGLYLAPFLKNTINKYNLRVKLAA